MYKYGLQTNSCFANIGRDKSDYVTLHFRNNKVKRAYPIETKHISA